MHSLAIGMSRKTVRVRGTCCVVTSACGSLSGPATSSDTSQAPATLKVDDPQGGDVLHVPAEQTEPSQRLLESDADSWGCDGDVGAVGWRQRIALAAARQG